MKLYHGSIVTVKKPSLRQGRPNTDYGKGFYIYTDEQRAESGCWAQYCYNIDYVNGWLYGAVQAINGIMKPINKEV